MSRVSLKTIEDKLYAKDEYGSVFADLDAELGPEELALLKKHYNIRTDVHRTCQLCQARQVIKYKDFHNENGERLKEFKVPCDFVPNQLPAAASDLLENMIQDGIEEDRALLILKASYDPVAWVNLMFGFDSSNPKWRLRPYQKEALRCSSSNLVARWGRRAGKALDLKTPIPTPTGWTTMGKLRVGDQVFDENGKPANVTFVTETMYDHDCYEVIFNDGTAIVADAEHQWSVETRSTRKNNARYPHIDHPMVTLTTEQMIANLKVGSKNESNYSIPLTKPLQYTNSKGQLLIDPYVLGYWLGDGTRGTSEVTIGVEDQGQALGNLADRGHRIGKKPSSDIQFTLYGLRSLLRDLGVLHDKYIPDIYLRASIEDRRMLLRGLMDSDGTIGTRGRAEYCSTDKQLAEDVFELLTGLGIRCTMKRSKSFLYGERKKDRYRIYINSSQDLFALKRKSERTSAISKPSAVRRYITDIRPVKSVPVRCITVDSPNHLYLAGKQCVPTHNTLCMVLKMLFLANNMKVTKGINRETGEEHWTGPSIIVVTPYQAQIRNIFDEMERLIKMNGDLVQEVDSAGTGNLYVKTPYYHIKFKNGAVISGFVSGVGAKVDGSGGGALRGQCLPGETEIQMEDGTYKRIDAIQLGDAVISMDGCRRTSARVTHVFEPSPKLMYRVTLSSGRQFTASAEHKFAGVQKFNNTTYRHLRKGIFQPDWRPLGDFSPGEYIVLNRAVPHATPSPFSPEELLFIGLMTGDGGCARHRASRNSWTFSTGRQECVTDFMGRLARLGDKAKVTRLSNGNFDICYRATGSTGRSVELLRQAGIYGSYSYEKTLSAACMQGGPEHHLALLAGLISTDGWVCLSNRGQVEVGFCSTSQRLAEQVQELFLKLGYVAVIRQRAKELNGQLHRPQWYVTLRSGRECEGFLRRIIVPGKEAERERVIAYAQSRSQYHQQFAQYKDLHFDKIKSIELVDEQLGYDISVSATENFVLRNGVVTHNSGHIIYLDEMDMIPDDILEKVVIPILLTSEDNILLATSTPIGKRARFYSYSLESPTFKEAYYPSTLLPQWSKMKPILEKDTTRESFEAEYLAWFVEGSHGVFKPSHIYAARKDYVYADCRNLKWWRKTAMVPEPSQMMTVMGIDWNKNAGSEFVVVKYDPGSGNFFVVETVNVSGSEFSGQRWKEEVLRLNYKWKPDYIYADEGYGHTIIEDLKLLSYNMRGKPAKNRHDVEAGKLIDRLVSFNFSSKVELRSPIDGTVITKTGKEFLVETSIKIFESEALWYSYEDDTIRKQALNYIVLRRSPTTNKPVYGPENESIGDHRLDALMLALGGVYLEFSMYSGAGINSSAPGFFSKEDLEKQKAPSAFDVISRMQLAGPTKLNFLDIKGDRARSDQTNTHSVRRRGRGGLNRKEDSVYEHYRKKFDGSAKREWDEDQPVVRRVSRRGSRSGFNKRRGRR